ncbi:hypothetical protein LUZ60_001263 [Juncus effusus]|nr:hypothetical protein LUZ60_001263 [Juncus effusus]
MYTEVVVEEKNKGWWRRVARPEILVLVFLIISSFFVIFFGGENGAFRSWIQNISKGIEQRDMLLGGLLSPNYNERKCLARYRSSQYRKPSPFEVSPYLIQKLREYEEYHKKCGPKSELYKQALKELKSGKNFNNSECKYTVFGQVNGLGNRMLPLVSTFIYTLLTKRVLLVEMTEESQNLFCEPFPDSSWELPSDFPIKDIALKFWQEAPESYLNLLENKNISLDANASPESLPPFVFLDAWSQVWHVNGRIFCENHQKILQKFTWMVMKSDCYFAASFFLLPEYEKELSRMFPVKESMFHHLGRYLFQPANPVWEIIDRFYKAYLSNADEKIGVQIRPVSWNPLSTEKIYEVINECSEKEKLLPKVGPTNLTASASNPTKRTAILVISLFAEYYEKLKSKYYEHPTVTGEMVTVYQPTHEQDQKTNLQSHNQKALAEMYLLSYCDKIMSSAMSTFGYIAHGLAGSKPWILRILGSMQPGPACVRSMSSEPCLHSPPLFECKPNTRVDPANTVPYLRTCEDIDNGVKLVG